MTELCLNPFFLRVLYLSKIILNIMRFVVPIVLIFKIIIDVYKQVINPQNEDGRKKIINRVMASIVIFMVPTLVSLLTTFISFAKSFMRFSTPFTSISFTIIFPLSIFSFISFLDVP